MNETPDNTRESSPTEAEDTHLEMPETTPPSLETKLEESEKKYMYLYAEFENFKKRSLRDRSDLLKFGWESLGRDLVQVLDNLSRATQATKYEIESAAVDPKQSLKNLALGVDMVFNQLKHAIEAKGATVVKSVGQAFDPHIHEAIAQEHSDQPEGTVIKEQLPGYSLNGRLLRAAQVIVSKGKA